MNLIIRKMLIACFVFFFSLTSANTSFSGESWNMSVQGIRVIGTGYKTDIDEIMPFNQFSGTAISCLLQISPSKILDFSQVESTINEFSDNTGKNLIDKTAMFGNGFGFIQQISKDKKAFLFEITGSNLPNTKATSLTASGEIVLYIGSSIDLIEHNNLSLFEGGIIDNPISPLRISKITKNNSGEYPITISFEAKTNLSFIESIEFYNADTSQIIDLKYQGSGSHNIVGDLSTLTFEHNYSMYEIPEKINVKINYWRDFHIQHIPYTISTSVGL